MSCICCCCCACTDGECAPCRQRCTSLVASQPAQDAMQDCTSGTRDTINSLIMTGGNIVGSILKGKQDQQILAVNAKAKQQENQNSMIMWIVIAFIAMVAFLGWTSRNG